MPDVPSSIIGAELLLTTQMIWGAFAFLVSDLSGYLPQALSVLLASLVLPTVFSSDNHDALLGFSSCQRGISGNYHNTVPASLVVKSCILIALFAQWLPGISEQTFL